MLQREYRVLALSRSGHHPIVDWIQRGVDKSFFINNVPKYHDPINPQERDKLVKMKRKSKIAFDCFIYNHENPPMDKLPRSSKISSKNREVVGDTVEFRNIIIIRDIYNFFASRLKHGLVHYGVGPTEEKCHLTSELWKQQARECLGITDFCRGRLVVIQYNQWFLSPLYRTGIAQRLRIKDTGLGKVTTMGGGSSFSRLEHRNEPEKLDVINRWKEFEKNRLFNTIVSDGELRELSYCLFGEMMTM